MEIITGTTDFVIREETAVAIGKFDGVHVGHRRLLEEIQARKTADCRSCVFTFDPPANLFFGKEGEKVLTTREEKRRLFELLGVDILVEFPLNEQTAAIPPREFVKQILWDQLNSVFVAAGEDLSFGAGGAGNAALLKEMAKTADMEVRIIDKVTVDGREVSSTLVREAVEQGDLPLAEKLLGEPYTLTGRVCRGNHIGHTLEMPTLNVCWPEKKLAPPCGVYFSGALLDGRYYRGISNIGYRPTIAEERKVLWAETYLYDFHQEAYGKEVSLFFYEFERGEQRFPDAAALKAQLAKDKEAGARYRC